MEITSTREAISAESTHETKTTAGDFASESATSGKARLLDIKEAGQSGRYLRSIPAESAVQMSASGMTFTRHTQCNDPDMLPRMPARVTAARIETFENVAFQSGAALNHLHLVLGGTEGPKALLRDRLALRVAEARVAFSGRPERAADLCDAVQMLRPGDLPGLAGDTCLIWRRAVERPVSVKSLGRALPTFELGQIAAWLDTGQGARDCQVLDGVRLTP